MNSLQRTATHEVLLMIQSFDITKEFRALGYSSLFEYLTKAHGYSEGDAQRRISAASLMKEVPQIEEDLKSGELTLTQVSLAKVAINQEIKASKSKGAKTEIQSAKKFEVINKIKTKNSFETKKILKQEFPSFEIPKPQAQPGKDNKALVTLEFSEESWVKIQKLMAKMSHKVPSQKLEDLLLYWVTALEKKEAKITAAAAVISPNNNQILTANDTLRRQSRSGQNGKMTNQKLTQSREFSAKNKRIYFSVAIKRTLEKQSQNQCEYVSAITGRRCESKRFLEIDHRIPLAKRGTNAPENLRRLCRAHNQQAAKDWGVAQCIVP